MTVFVEQYGVTQALLEKYPAFVLEREGELLGFHAFSPKEGELEFFYA